MVTFGVQIEPQFGYSYDEILDVGRECEGLGFTTLTVSDHFMLREDSIGLPAMECWTLLSALAVDLHKVRIGPLVSCNSYRQPSLLAKMAATVDVLSGGRLEFGIGAGWKKSEYDAYGYPFPSIRERVDRMAEAIDIITRLWVVDEATFKGRYYAIEGAMCNPKPIQRPRPMIWVGGSGDRLLRVAAKLADGVNIPFSTPDTFKERLDRLRHYCEKGGREYSSMKKSHFLWALLGREGQIDRMVEDFAHVLGMSVEDVRGIGKKGFIGTPSDLVERLHGYVKAGAEHIILGFAKGWEKSSMELFHDEVLGALR
ncbi:MAG: TIGR03560 family F420-dependent LLM class oxidoreductase [Thermoplasmata archaeon]